MLLSIMIYNDVLVRIEASLSAMVDSLVKADLDVFEVVGVI